MRRSFLLVWLAAAGCGGPAAPVYPVAGTLLVGGRPAGNARLAFHPLAPDTARPVGVTAADGTFQLTTHAAGDGAPAGEYVVTLVWPDPAVVVDECDCPDPATHDHLSGAYADPATSPLRAAVRPGANTVTLEATPTARGWNLPRR